jgi:hypothetical protein
MSFGSSSSTRFLLLVPGNLVYLDFFMLGWLRGQPVAVFYARRQRAVRLKTNPALQSPSPQQLAGSCPLHFKGRPTPTQGHSHSLPAARPAANEIHDELACFKGKSTEHVNALCSTCEPSSPCTNFFFPVPFTPSHLPLASSSSSGLGVLASSRAKNHGIETSISWSWSV